MIPQMSLLRLGVIKQHKTKTKPNLYQWNHLFESVRDRQITSLRSNMSAEKSSMTDAVYYDEYLFTQDCSSYEKINLREIITLQPMNTRDGCNELI